MTSDNPRAEEPLAIIQDVLQGTGVDVEIDPDRRSAIFGAVAGAGAGDVVVVAGKGHEQGQETAGVVVPFDDRAVARRGAARGGVRRARLVAGRTAMAPSDMPRGVSRRDTPRTCPS